MISKLSKPALVKESLAQKAERQRLELRESIWPTLDPLMVWNAKRGKAGYTQIPRTIPLILRVMDQASKGKPVSSTYLELWCRAFPEYIVVLNRPKEMAFHAGFSGERAERTWATRIRILKDLGFIDVKAGPSGALSYALIYNPYIAIQQLHKFKRSGITEADWNALQERILEIGAADLDNLKGVGGKS